MSSNNQNNRVWVGEKDLTRDQEFLNSVDKEFNDDISLLEKAPELSGNRRDFLKMLGFGVTAATVAAGCDIPVNKALPYVVKPSDIVPGVATYYATTYVAGGDVEPILVKTREGRPIKIEGNAVMKSSTGTSSRAQASVLELYNIKRYRTPQIKDGGVFADSDWATLDKRVKSALNSASSIKFVTNTIVSPSTEKAIAKLKATYPGVDVLTYDPVSYAGMLDANMVDFGKRALPTYHFDKAEVIVSFDADFLGSWLPSGSTSSDYIKGRDIFNSKSGKMSRHFQVESHMSLTGSNADNRVLVRPSQIGSAIAYVAGKIVGGGGNVQLPSDVKSKLDKVANQLRAAGSRGLVVAGSNNDAEQQLVNAINNAIGAYGTTLDMGDANLTKKGDEADLGSLIKQLNSKVVDVVIFNQCNPLYDYPSSGKLAEALGKAKAVISIGYAENETTNASTHIAPVTHFLENWGDAKASESKLYLQQPTISKIFDGTRQLEEMLMSWAGSPMLAADIVKESINGDAFAGQSKYLSSRLFWENALQQGGVSSSSGGSAVYSGSSISSLMSRITKPSNSSLEIKFFETSHMGNGQSADNPWLMEMPDPVARTSWGNYLAVPVGFDGVRTMVGYNELKDGDLVEVKLGDITYTVPVVQQFGMQKDTVALALGYGRTNSSPLANEVGVNVNPALPISSKGKIQYFRDDVTVSNKIGKEENFSCVQYHHTYGVKAEDEATGETINADEAAAITATYGLVKQGYQGSITDRSVIYTSTLKELDGSIAHLKEKRDHAEHLNQNTIYPYDEFTADKYSQGHHWGMHVDLNSCTGCGACTVACMAENNVPVVGKREVSRHHEMTWLRIDRYYYGDLESPNVVYQPMMCQHCDNAPCENVCPVNATNHSSEGLNQMTYNRCVGTRYCANNCPYKVRRFNWMDYTTADLFPANQPGLGIDTDVPFYADDLTRMVLNPDVTVRVRGVIEKCSFCVQRIQEGKLTAKTEGRRLEDSDVTTACAAACNTNAITFGDMNNKKGDLSKKLDSPLNYIALEEINVRSAVTYTMKVNNRDESLDA